VTLTRRAHHGSMQHLLAASEPNSPVTPHKATNESFGGPFELHSWLCAEEQRLAGRCAFSASSTLVRSGGHTWLPMRLRAAVLHTETVQLDRG
jgi:hypothetical protein